MANEETQDFGTYIAAWRERLVRQEREQQERAHYLRQVARACADRLVEAYGARKVYLFGSLVAPEQVHSQSDIDLAAEGLEDRLYFKALADIWTLLPAGVELDLVPLEDARPSLAERIKREGVLLHVS